MNITDQDIDRVLARWPDLGAYGLAGGGGRPDLERVKVCAAWLSLRCPAAPRRGKRLPGSYSLKHAVERAVAPLGWIGNGELITAALILGLDVRPIESTPNATIAITNRLRAHACAA